MAASRYRRFLKLCEEWPVDETKRGRDLGAYLRQRVAQAFREGENTQVAEPEACDQMYESLARLHSNYYKHKASWPLVAQGPDEMQLEGRACVLISPLPSLPLCPGDQYPRPRDTSFSGLSLEEYKLILSTDTLEDIKEMDKSTWKKLQEKFAPKGPEEDHKA
ncbi:ubiquinol-cytochrome c reductase complex assembly factor 2 isoform X1 [Pongo pygmaeus]|uniref:Mitochondrial nucleoid factor 1 n=1 Tax=Pongo abelii TaxID=9601 RepID=A0A2J8Y313_PONAB|nr:ubiquinol-cytochrome-c reductase complex assembly factor 2 isoform X1 [Pongo abelii]XP_054346219.1 ubiquinol-cytochrome-c reductase complex assembly factor 2 isoform X1 [Pongo pygmaeus]PNJ88681.1 UQCC2 isoform 5 [Pongo abelii]